MVPAVVMGLLAVGGGAFFLGTGVGADERDADATTSSQVDQGSDPDQGQAEDATAEETNSTPAAPTAPSVDRSGNPIVDGWYVLVSSALKGSAESASLPSIAAANGGQVVDTDSYQTGFAIDGRGGTLNEQAAVAPTYWPGSNAVAAVVGPFPNRSSAEQECQRRNVPLGSCVRQFRAVAGPS